MTLKAALAAALAAAIFVGFSLPAAHSHAHPKSQIAQIDLGAY
ncbi:hypothetical protein [Phenylobacterium sp.]|jgi:hypothetical protein